MRRVLITRPEPDASGTAETLRYLGFEPVVLPLSRVVSLENAKLPDKRFDAVVLSSANGIRYAGNLLLKRLSGVPCLTVGSKTAQVARKAGFHQVFDAGGDAADLVRLVQRVVPKSSAIAYLCGQERRPEVEDQLSEAGYALTVMPVYSIEKVSYTTQEMHEKAGRRIPDAALVYSERSAFVLREFLVNLKLSQDLEFMKVICISERCKMVFSDMQYVQALVSEAPSEPSMLKLLQSGQA